MKKVASYNITCETVEKLNEYCKNNGIQKSFFVDKAIQEKLKKDGRNRGKSA